jgi:hypothetical protein
VNRTKLLALATTTLLAGLLTACTSFAPVYGDRSGAGMEAVRFNFASPDSRLEQIVLDRLKLAFPGQAGPDDPLLDINVSTSSLPRSQSNAFPIAKPVNTRVEATLTVTRDGEVEFSATRFADTAYQSGKLTPVDIASATGAPQTAARSVAEALRAAVLASYRPTLQ